MMGIRIKALIVEDSEVDTQLLVRELRRGGYDVEFERVETRQQMAAALESGGWNLIISDYALPGFSGMDALALYQTWKLDIPFILVSGQIGETTAVEMMKAGVHDYLLKDNLARLVPAVRRELQETQVRRERKQAETLLRLTQFTVEHASQVISWISPNGSLVYVNERGQDLFGLPLSELVDRKIWEFYQGMSTETWQKHWDELKQSGSSLQEMTMTSARGDLYLMEVAATYVKFEGSELEVRFSRDITDRKRMENDLKYMSTHDLLTGLFNRNLFETELSRLQESRSFPISILIADVDGLKEVNDSQGHAAGDQLLKDVAQILMTSFRAEDVIARLGGDEFAILLPETDRVTAQAALVRLQDRLEEHNHSQRVTMLKLSIGAATAEIGDSLEAIMRQADDWMYKEKTRKKARE